MIRIKGMISQSIFGVMILGILNLKNRNGMIYLLIYIIFFEELIPGYVAGEGKPFDVTYDFYHTLHVQEGCIIF